jgi:hypothetical protein
MNRRPNTQLKAIATDKNRNQVVDRIDVENMLGFNQPLRCPLYQ